jgi:thiol-disulfide isomerase/thioredoxin
MPASSFHPVPGSTPLKLARIVLALICGFTVARAEGPFSDLSFDAATAKAKADGKLLLVDFIATWCPPCRQMEKETWPDEAVGKWIGEHAVAIQVDVDKAPELAKQFGFGAIPTVIFLKDGKELDRHSGLRKPDEFVKWGDAVLAGRSETADLATAAKSLPPSDDVDARYAATNDAMSRGDDDAALQGFLWLWPHTRYVLKYWGVRLTFMPNQMARLAQRHEPARKAFAEILDELQQRIDAPTGATSVDCEEWCALCRSFHERDRVVAWYERRRDQAGRLFAEKAKDPLVSKLTDEVFDFLVEAGRPVDAARLCPLLTERADREVALCKDGLADADQQWPETWRTQCRADVTAACRERLATVYAVARAAGLPAQAAHVAEQLLAVLDDAASRISLVKRTLDLAPTQTDGLAKWLDEAEKLGADVGELRARLSKAEPAAPAPAPGQ